VIAANSAQIVDAGRQTYFKLFGRYTNTNLPFVVLVTLETTLLGHYSESAREDKHLVPSVNTAFFTPQ